MLALGLGHCPCTSRGINRLRGSTDDTGQRVKECGDMLVENCHKFFKTFFGVRVKQRIRSLLMPTYLPLIFRLACYQQAGGMGQAAETESTLVLAENVYVNLPTPLFVVRSKTFSTQEGSSLI